MMSPLADHVNASICPGVSMKAYLHAVETSEVFENFFICIVCLVALHLLAAMRCTYLQACELFSRSWSTVPKRVAKRFKDVIIAPFGPRLYLNMWVCELLTNTAGL